MHPSHHHHPAHGHHHACIRRGEHDDGLGGGRGHRGDGDGPRGGRIFGHGGLRFVLLQLIADKPSHGYELIKSIEVASAAPTARARAPSTRRSR